MQTERKKGLQATGPWSGASDPLARQPASLPICPFGLPLRCLMPFTLAQCSITLDLHGYLGEVGGRVLSGGPKM